MSDLEQELSRLKKLCDEATEGPWKEVGTGKDGKTHWIEATEETGCDEDDECFYEVCRFPDASYGYASYWDKNPEFIAESRTAMPRLIEALKFVCSEFETAKEDPNYWYKKEVESRVIQILRGE